MEGMIIIMFVVITISTLGIMIPIFILKDNKWKSIIKEMLLKKEALEKDKMNLQLMEETFEFIRSTVEKTWSINATLSYKTQTQILEVLTLVSKLGEHIYNDCFLEALKKDPTNANLKQDTLKCGRLYSSLTRFISTKDNRVTIFDEMALNNDITAACAGSNNIVVQQSDDNFDKIKKLAELKEKGLINDEEYETKRKELLSKMV